MRPDLAHILADEETHVGFFETEVKAPPRRRPGTSERGEGVCESLDAADPEDPGALPPWGDGLEPYQAELTESILGTIRGRFTAIGLLSGA